MDNKDILITYNNPQLPEYLGPLLDEKYSITYRNSDHLEDDGRDDYALILFEYQDNIHDIKEYATHNSNLVVMSQSPLSNEEAFEFYSLGVIDILYLNGENNAMLQRLSADINYLESLNLLQNEVQESKDLTAMLLNNIGEYGTLLAFMKTCFTCTTFAHLEQALIKAMKQYGLSACVHMQTIEGIHSVSTCDMITPLEHDLLEQASSSKKIHEFKQRCVLCEKNVSMLIKNMPLHDPDKVGRLKDHLAMLLDASEEKVKVLNRNELMQQHSAKIRQLIHSVKTGFSAHETKLIDVIDNMIEKFNDTLFSLGLTDEQEHMLCNLLETSMNRLITIYSESNIIEEHLNNLVADIETYLVEPEPSPEDSSANVEDDDVELF